MPANVEMTSDGRSTQYVITGSLPEITEAIDRIEKAFHPAGYGTSFTEPREVQPNVWRVEGDRSNSCD